LELTPPVEFPDRLHSVSTDGHDSVVKHKRKIAIARDEGHLLANFQVNARGELDRGMLGREAKHSTRWVISENW
jgi:hypothetical protein